jgi:signal transduction histidine kinase
MLLKDHSRQLDAKGREYLTRIRSAGEHMHRLIESIAALARITQHPFEARQVDLSAAAQSLAAELADSEPAREVRFDIQAGLTARGDPELLTIVLRNLLENAWKFTSGHARACIEFGAAVRGAETRFFVRDDGAGFDMSFADKLFRPFERLHGLDQFPGTGIGLAVVDRIVRRHHGRLWADARLERGATFYFTLDTEAS